MSLTIHAREALTPAGFQDNLCVTIRGDRIEQVAHGTQGDVTVDRLVPGMIDLHNHGGKGFDASRPTEEGFAAWTGMLAQHGVTDVLATVSTNDPAVMAAAIDKVGEAMAMQRAGRLHGARIAGIHLEGPFISDKRAGAMNKGYIQAPSLAAYDKIVHGQDALIRLVSLAPEREGAADLIASLCQRGVRVQAGHTDATFEEGMAAFATGVGGVCHFFNAARGIHHREPGVLTAALLSPGVYCEIICDTIHLHPGVLRLVIDMKGAGRVCVVSDAVMATGLPDGEYQSAGHPVVVKGGVSRTPEGALSGGCVPVSQGVRNLCEVGIQDADAYAMASAAPAEWMGFSGLGAIKPGKLAHLAALDANRRVVRTWIGEESYEGDAP